MSALSLLRCLNGDVNPPKQIYLSSSQFTLNGYPALLASKPQTGKTPALVQHASHTGSIVSPSITIGDAATCVHRSMRQHIYAYATYCFPVDPQAGRWGVGK